VQRAPPRLESVGLQFHLREPPEEKHFSQKISERPYRVQDVPMAVLLSASSDRYPAWRDRWNLLHRRARVNPLPEPKHLRNEQTW